MRIRISVIGVMLALLFCVGPVQADYFARQANHTAAMQMMGQTQPETFDTVSMWYSEDVGRADMGDSLSVLYFIDKGKMLMLNHREKQYVSIPLDMAKLVDQVTAETGEDSAGGAADMMKGMMEGLMKSTKCEVTPTDETMKVGDWDARKYDVKLSIMGMTLNHEVWATKDIDMDPRLMVAANNAMMALMPGMDEAVAEMGKIDGVPVKTVVSGSIMGATLASQQELIEFREADAPAGTFEVPDDYKEVDAASMMGGRGR